MLVEENGPSDDDTLAERSSNLLLAGAEAMQSLSSSERQYPNNGKQDGETRIYIMNQDDVERTKYFANFVDTAQDMENLNQSDPYQ